MMTSRTNPGRRIRVPVFLLLGAALVGFLAPAAHAAEEEPLPACEVAVASSGLLARDFVVSVLPGEQATVDLTLNDALQEGRAYLVEPVVPPPGVTLSLGPSGVVTVSVNEHYSGPKWTTYAYNLWDGTACQEGGYTLPTTSTAMLTVHVSDPYSQPTRLRDRLVRVERGMTKVVAMAGLREGQTVEIDGTATKHGISVHCSERSCTVRAAAVRTARWTVFRLRVADPSGRPSRTAALVVRSR